uniref:Uncharacterized protein n=1 Tax=Sphaerodactylus townsendi TaxID=933632 RepID=A0ACB8EN72_9SAUR
MAEKCGSAIASVLYQHNCCSTRKTTKTSPGGKHRCRRRAKEFCGTLKIAEQAVGSSSPSHAIAGFLLPFPAELPRPANPGITSFPFHQEKVPLHPIYTNGFGVARGGSVRQQQPQMPGKQHVGSTASVCSKSSRKSCKSTASQIQEEAKDGEQTLGSLRLAFMHCCPSKL